MIEIIDANLGGKLGKKNDPNIRENLQEDFQEIYQSEKFENPKDLMLFLRESKFMGKNYAPLCEFLLNGICHYQEFKPKNVKLV